LGREGARLEARGPTKEALAALRQNARGEARNRRVFGAESPANRLTALMGMTNFRVIQQDRAGHRQAPRRSRSRGCF